MQAHEAKLREQAEAKKQLWKKPIGGKQAAMIAATLKAAEDKNKKKKI